MAYKVPYEETICPDCGNKRLVRKWANESGVCRSCSAKRRKPLTDLGSNFIRGEQIGRAPQTIYYWQACPQCQKPRWMRANISGTIAPNRLCYKCTGFNVQQSKGRQGEKNGHWRGGRLRTKAGYIRVYSPENPRSVHRHILEHILIWESVHKKSLPKNWIIHHLNGIRDDNRPENLLAMPRKAHSPGTYIRALQERIRQLEAQEIIGDHCISEHQH